MIETHLLTPFVVCSALRRLRHTFRGFFATRLEQSLVPLNLERVCLSVVAYGVLWPILADSLNSAPRLGTHPHAKCAALTLGVCVKSRPG